MQRPRFIFFSLFFFGTFLTLQASVRIAGNEEFSRERLQEYLEDSGLEGRLTLKSEPALEERAGRLLQEFYRRHGFPLVKVSPQKGALSFRIDEGPRADLSKVTFRGNQAFTDERLLHFFPIGKPYKEDSLSQALVEVASFYRRRGYPFFKIHLEEPEVVERDRSDHFPIPFSIRRSVEAQVEVILEEGARFRIGRVRVPRELRTSEIPVPEADSLYDAGLLLGMRRSASEHYRAQGLLLKELELLQDFQPSEGEVDIILKVAAYDPLLIRRIDFAGNESLPQEFYRRELTLQEGRLLDPRELDRSLLNLSRTGTLTSISREDVTLQIDEEEGYVDLLFDLEERKKRRIAYSLDPGDLFGPEASLLFSVLNFFGLGEVLGLEVSYGDQTSRLAVALTSRYLLGTDLPVTMLLGFFKRHTGFDLPGIDDELGQVLGTDRVGFTGSFAYRLDEGGEAGLRLTGEQFSGEAPATRRFVFDPFYRDHEAGDFFQASNRFSLFPNSNLDWNLRPTVVGRRVFPDRKGDRELVVRYELSHARFFGLGDQLSDRIYPRRETVRGFSAVTSGPWAADAEGAFPVGGDTLAAISTEYVVPAGERWSLVPFLDLGWSASLSSLSDYALFGETRSVLRASTGSEIRLDLPAGLPTARVAFAWNPLRLDELLQIGDGVSRLRDPRFRVRFFMDP